jgi:hypothetical protein
MELFKELLKALFYFVLFVAALVIFRIFFSNVTGLF